LAVLLQRLAVSLSGTVIDAQVVVLCNQPRVLDVQTRGATFAEKAPLAIVDEVFAQLLTLME
jgi:hypothetical protein